MKILSEVDALIDLAKRARCWILYVSFHCDDWEEVKKAAPYLQDHLQVLMDGHGCLICDSEEECYKYYNLTVGEDGPTATNPYDGPARVYALMIGPEGCTSENT